MAEQAFASPHITSITVAPISRPVVKGAVKFLAAPAANVPHSLPPATMFEQRPFFRFMAASA
jgi:hypothetical protein